VTEALLQASGLGHGHAARWLFRRVDLTLASGGVLAILGPNGRGKTTLLRALAGTLRPREGAVDRRAPVAYVPQSHAGSFAYAARDMVLMGRARHLGPFRTPGRADRAIADAALAEVGLAAKADIAYDRLSGGERQLVLIARALAAEGRVLLLDEPASALDLANQGLVLRLARRLSGERGIAVAMTTHHPQHAQEIADAVLLLGEPEHHRIGPVDDVLTEAGLTALYGLPVRRAALAGPGLPPAVLVPDYGLAR
jgi:iron complex transport system ATP-binding protein